MHVLGGTYELIKRGGNAPLACGEWFCANRRRQGIIRNEKIRVSVLRKVNFEVEHTRKGSRCVHFSAFETEQN